MKTLFIFVASVLAISSHAHAASVQLCGSLSVKTDRIASGVHTQNAFARTFNITDAGGRGVFELFTTDVANAQLVNQLNSQQTLVLVTGLISTPGEKILKVKSIESVRACYHN